MPRDVFIHIELAALALSGICLAASTPSQAAAISCCRAPVRDIVSPHLLLIAERKTFWVEPISGESGSPVPVFVTLPDGVRYAPGSARKPAYLQFRNVPDAIRFSVGFRVKDNWAVGLGDINKLTLLSEPGYTADLQLQAVLHLGGEHEPIVRDINIELYPATKKPEPATTAAIGRETKESAPEPNQALVPEEVAELLQRGDTLLRAGDFEAARLAYSELASHGNAKAALGMARTYDPEVLRRLFVVGLKPDAGKAMQWYRKAAELGDASAREYIERLTEKH